MFKFRSLSQLTRRTGIALVLAVSLGAALLPTVAMAAPLEGQYGQHGPHRPNCVNNHYIVKKGDTLSGIAFRYHVNLWSLKDVNWIGNVNRIYAGEYLCLPAGYHSGGYPEKYEGGHHGGYPGEHQGGYPGGHPGYHPGGHPGGH